MALENKLKRKIFNTYKDRHSAGSALVEATIIMPFLLMLVWLVIAFMSYSKNYGMASQTARNAAMEAAEYYNISSLVGTGDAQMVRAYDQTYCPHGTSACEQSCSTTSDTHSSSCAHWVAQARSRQFIDLYALPLSSPVITTGVTMDGEGDVIFKATIEGNYISSFQVFGTKRVKFESKAFVRTATAVPTPSESGVPTPSESGVPTPSGGYPSPDPQ